MMGYTTLISDCDGVLIDSEVVAHEVLVRETQAVFSNVDCNAFLVSSFGQKTEELVQQVAQFAGQAVPDGFLKHLRRVTDASIEQHAFPVKHVEILVNHPRLKAVASNSGMARIVSAVSKVGLSARSDVRIFSADQVKQPKPAPDLYLLAAHEMALQPAECVVIEDSTSGVLAALAAGMTVIGFVGGLHIPTQHAADLREMGVLTVFDTMQELPQVLSRSVGWGN